MDFGALGLDGLVGSESGPPSSQVTLASSTEALQKGFGSRHFKQERSGSAEDDRGGSKLQRTSNFESAKTMPLHQASTLLRSNSMLSLDGSDSHSEQMLSFSSNKSDASFLSRATSSLVDRGSQIAGFPFYQTPSTAAAAAAYSRVLAGLCSVLSSYPLLLICWM